METVDHVRSVLDRLKVKPRVGGTQVVEPTADPKEPFTVPDRTSKSPTLSELLGRLDRDGM